MNVKAENHLFEKKIIFQAFIFGFHAVVYVTPFTLGTSRSLAAVVAQLSGCASEDLDAKQNILLMEEIRHPPVEVGSLCLRVENRPAFLPLFS